MRTLGKIVAAVAVAVVMGSGTAMADPVGTVPTPEKCYPIIGCIKK